MENKYVPWKHKYVYAVLGVLAFFYVILYSIAGAQPETGTIRGFVKDSSNGEPLCYVNVYLTGARAGAMSDEHGYYVISQAPAGTDTLIVALLGYQRFRQWITVKVGETVTLDVRLEPEAIELTDIVVTAEQERHREEVRISTQTLSQRELKTIPGLAEPDVFRIVQLLPGVVAGSDFSSKFYVRGGSADQNLILLDGITIYNPYHLGGVFSTFNIDAIKESELLKGGFPAEYGGRLSSVLRIITREGNTERFEGTGGISLLSSKLTLEGPFLQGAWLLSGRRTYFDQIFKGTKYHFPYYFYDIQAKCHQNLSYEDKVSLSGYWGNDVLHFDPFNMIWGNRALTVHWRHLVTDRLFSTFFLATSHFNQSLKIAGLLELKNGVMDYSTGAALSYFCNEHHHFKMGYFYKYMKAQFKQKFQETTFVDYHPHSNYAALYFQDKWKPDARWIIQPGVRLNYFSSQDAPDHFKVTPRLSLRYLLTDRTTVKGSWGVYSQYLNTVNDEDSQSPNDLWFPIVGKLQPGEAFHYIGGIEHKLPWRTTLEVEGYYKSFDHLILLDTKSDSDKFEEVFKQGPGFAFGAELLWKREVGRLTGWTSYTLGWTRKTIEGEEYFPRYDRRHSFNWISTYKLSRRWSCSLVWVYGTGFPYTQKLGRYREYIYEQEPEDREIVGLKNNRRYPVYSRVDINLRYDRRHMGAYLQIINVTNRENVYLYWFEYDENPARKEAVTMFPILPTLGVEFRF